MRLINAFLIGLLIPSMALAGLPPTTIKGQTDASPKTKFGFQVPFQQATDLGGISSLIETGNSNILPDPGFEASVSGWTASGGATATANTTAKGTGLKGYDWDSNAAAQTLVSQTITIPDGFKGKNGTVSCSIKTVSGTATHTITAEDGTNNIVSPQTIASSTSIFTDNKVNFIFPSSGSIRVKITSVAANEPEIYVDDCRLGLADNIGTVQQARLIGTVKITGCSGTWTTTSTTYATYAAQTGCSYAVTGEALAPTTNIPAIRFASLPPGEYLLQAEGRIENNAGNQASWFQFFDGTNTAREESSTASATGTVGVVTGINQSITYSTTQSNATLQIRSKVTAGGTSVLYAINNYPLVIKVYYFPSASQQAVTPAQQRPPTTTTLTSGSGTYTTPNGATYLIVTAIGGGGGGGGAINQNGTTCVPGSNGSSTTFGSIITATGGAGATSTSCETFPVPITGSSFTGTGTLLKIVDGGSPPVGQSFSSNCGVSCSSATSESSGGNNIFNIPSLGNTSVSFGGGGKGVRGDARNSGFSIGSFGGYSGSVVSVRINNPNSTYTYSIGSGGAGGVSTRTGGTGSNGAIIIEEYYSQTAPLLINSVTSNSSGAERIERAIIQNNGTCSVLSQSGTWISSVSRPGTGQCTLTFSTPTFSSAPSCTCSSQESIGSSVNTCTVFVNGTTSATPYVQQGSSSTGFDRNMQIICMGSR